MYGRVCVGGISDSKCGWHHAHVVRAIVCSHHRPAPRRVSLRYLESTLAWLVRVPGRVSKQVSEKERDLQLYMGCASEVSSKGLVRTCHRSVWRKNWPHHDDASKG
jgi:hypothetical protein